MIGKLYTLATYFEQNTFSKVVLRERQKCYNLTSSVEESRYDL